jgi:putative oxidoreductase
LNIRWFLTGGAGGGSAAADAGLLALRVFVGLALAFAHGINKIPPAERFVSGVADLGFPAPFAFAWAASLSEFLGGILLALGLLTRPASFFLLATMLVAGFMRHAADPFRDKELAFTFAAVALLFLLAGAGRYSLDHLIRHRFRKV